MPESGTYGSVRGVPSNGHPYRDRCASRTGRLAVDNAVALPTAPTFAHKLHSLSPPMFMNKKSGTAGFYGGDKYSDAGGGPQGRANPRNLGEFCTQNFYKVRSNRVSAGNEKAPRPIRGSSAGLGV